MSEEPKLEQTEEQKQIAFRTSDHYEYVTQKIKSIIRSKESVDNIPYNPQDPVITTVAVGVSQEMAMNLTDLLEDL